MNLAQSVFLLFCLFGQSKAVIKRMLSRDKDPTWKTDIHNKEYIVTKVIQEN